MTSVKIIHIQRTHLYHTLAKALKMRLTKAVLLLYKCLVFAPNAAGLTITTEPAASELSTKDDTSPQNEMKELTCPLTTCIDLLNELGATEEKLQATETRLKALEISQQELMSRLTDSEAQIEEIKMENQGETDVFEDLIH